MKKFKLFLALVLLFNFNIFANHQINAIRLIISHDIFNLGSMLNNSNYKNDLSLSISSQKYDADLLLKSFNDSNKAYDYIEANFSYNFNQQTTDIISLTSSPKIGFVTIGDFGFNKLCNISDNYDDISLYTANIAILLNANFKFDMHSFDVTANFENIIGYESFQDISASYNLYNAFKIKVGHKFIQSNTSSTVHENIIKASDAYYFDINIDTGFISFSLSKNLGSNYGIGSIGINLLQLFNTKTWKEDNMSFSIGMIYINDFIHTNIKSRYYFNENINLNLSLASRTSNVNNQLVKNSYYQLGLEIMPTFSFFSPYFGIAGGTSDNITSLNHYFYFLVDISAGLKISPPLYFANNSFSIDLFGGIKINAPLNHGITLNQPYIGLCLEIGVDL